jgi:cytochrome c
MREQGDNKPPLPEAKSEAAPEPKAAAKPAPEKPAAMAPEKPAAMAPEKPAAKPAQEKPAAMAPEKPAMPEPEKPAAMTPAVNDTLGARLAKGDASRGKGVSAKCAICHTFESGGKNKIGPNLYGVAGRKVGSVVDFKYSDAIRAKGGTWTFEQLDCLITKPKECVPGTKMPFPGLPDAAARADLLVFLRTLSDNPVPLPAP